MSYLFVCGVQFSVFFLISDLDVLALLVVSIIWALSFGLIKGQLTGIDPSLVAAIRLTLCFLIFIPFTFKGLFREFNSKLVVLGAIQFGMMYWAYITSYQYLPAYLVAVFTIFTPLYVFIFHSLFKKSFNAVLLLPIALSIFGAAIMVFKSPSATDWLMGFTVLQIANIVFAFGQVAYKHMHLTIKSSHATNMTQMYLGAAIFSSLVAISQVSDAALLQITTKQWGVLLYLGTVASGIGFYLWNLGATQTKAEHLAIMNNGYIPLAVIFSSTLFGEEINVEKLLIGGVVILISLMWAERVSHRSA